MITPCSSEYPVVCNAPWQVAVASYIRVLILRGVRGTPPLAYECMSADCVIVVTSVTVGTLDFDQWTIHNNLSPCRGLYCVGRTTTQLPVLAVPRLSSHILSSAPFHDYSHVLDGEVRGGAKSIRLSSARRLCEPINTIRRSVNSSRFRPSPFELRNLPHSNSPSPSLIYQHHHAQYVKFGRCRAPQSSATSDQPCQVD